MQTGSIWTYRSKNPTQYPKHKPYIDYVLNLWGGMKIYHIQNHPSKTWTSNRHEFVHVSRYGWDILEEVSPDIAWTSFQHNFFKGKSLDYIVDYFNRCDENL